MSTALVVAALLTKRNAQPEEQLPALIGVHRCGADGPHQITQCLDVASLHGLRHLLVQLQAQRRAGVGASAGAKPEPLEVGELEHRAIPPSALQAVAVENGPQIRDGSQRGGLLDWAVTSDPACNPQT